MKLASKESLLQAENWSSLGDFQGDLMNLMRISLQIIKLLD